MIVTLMFKYPQRKQGELEEDVLSSEGVTGRLPFDHPQELYFTSMSPLLGNIAALVSFT